MGKCEWIGTKAKGSPTEWKFKPCNDFEPIADTNSFGQSNGKVFCKGCQSDIPQFKPEPEQPIIKKSGETFVALDDGVDLFCFNPDLDNGGWDINKFLIQKKHGNLPMSWKPISEIKITDEIAKLSPIVKIKHGAVKGRLAQLIRVMDNDYVIYELYDKDTEQDCYLSESNWWELTTVSDLEDNSE
jgi:hypothetical protein